MPSPTSRVVKKGSKIRRRFSSGMPWPESAMNSSTASDSGTCRAPHADLPRRPRPHRLFGVQQQVEQRLLQLAAVAEDGRQAGLELRLQLDRVQAELVGAQRQDAVHHVGDVLLGARGGLPAREREQVADDLRGALGLLGDAPQIVRRAPRSAGSCSPRSPPAVPPAGAARSRSRSSAGCSARAPRRRRAARWPRASRPAAAAPGWP